VHYWADLQSVHGLHCYGSITRTGSVSEYILVLTVWLVIMSYYIHQGRYVRNRRCLFVCLLATLRKSFWTDLYEIFREGWQWASEQMVRFWWRSGSRTRIATLVRRALAEVCTVPVFLVIIIIVVVVVVIIIAAVTQDTQNLTLNVFGISHCRLHWLLHQYPCVLKRRLHDTTGCQSGCQTPLTTGLTTVLNEQLFVQPVVKPRSTTGLTTGCRTMKLGG